MAIPTIPSAVACTGAPFGAIDTDVLAVPWFEDEGPAAVPGIDQASGGGVARALASEEFAGKAYDVFTAGVRDSGWRATRLALVGAGKRSASGSDLARKLATAAGLWARQHRVARIGFVLREDLGDRPQAVEMTQAIGEGLTLAGV